MGRHARDECADQGDGWTLGVQFGTRIEQLLRDGDGWQMDGEGAPDARFDAVVVALPAEQAGPLLSHVPASAMATLADQTASDPCWTLMAFRGTAWRWCRTRCASAARSAGPRATMPSLGAQAAECWVVQASPEWSRAHLEDEATAVETALLDQLAEANRCSAPAPIGATAHRWRFTRSGTAGEEGSVGRAAADRRLRRLADRSACRGGLYVGAAAR